MSWSKEEALTDPLVRNPVVFDSEYRFHLRDIPIEITIRLYRPLHSGPVIVRQSHHLSIPRITVPAPASPENELDTGAGAALHNAIDQMVSLYNAAKTQGLTPEPSWLIPSKEFC